MTHQISSSAKTELLHNVKSELIHAWLFTNEHIKQDDNGDLNIKSIDCTVTVKKNFHFEVIFGEIGFLLDSSADVLRIIRQRVNSIQKSVAA